MLSKRTVLSMVVLLGLTLFVAFLLHFFLKSSAQNESVSIIEDAVVLSDQEQSNVGLPMRLIIPNINIDTAIEYVGLTSDGAMDVPKDLNEVGWFDLGPRPGENGSSVITGHYGLNNISAVFDNLYKLGIGDEIFVEDEKGMIITFIVREIRIYDKDDTVPEVFSSSDTKAHLNLITCIGDWNQTERTYSDRLIVFTDIK